MTGYNQRALTMFYYELIKMEMISLLNVPPITPYLCVISCCHVMFLPKKNISLPTASVTLPEQKIADTNRERKLPLKSFH
jgi:hypothetical protein